VKDKKLNKMDNKLIMEKLKELVWENYMGIKSCDFKGWYDGLSPIERAAWNVKFDELH